MKYNTLEYGRAVASLLLAGCFCAAFLVRCASINNNLTGGPKDTLPPVILRMDPDNFTTRYPLTGSNRKIYVEFDEFVQLKDQQKEFFTSPQKKKKPQLSIS
ncbi:MAG: Ig-like domain-containing protein, partial [Alistipes sp.]